MNKLTKLKLSMQNILIRSEECLQATGTGTNLLSVTLPESFFKFPHLITLNSTRSLIYYTNLLQDEIKERHVYLSDTNKTFNEIGETHDKFSYLTKSQTWKREKPLIFQVSIRFRRQKTFHNMPAINFTIISFFVKK